MMDSKFKGNFRTGGTEPKPVYEFNEKFKLIKKWSNMNQIQKERKYTDKEKKSLYSAIKRGILWRGSYWSYHEELYTKPESYF